MIVCMGTVIFRVLHIIVLVVAKHIANAVAQKCIVLSHPSKCILICGCECKDKSLHLKSRV